MREEILFSIILPSYNRAHLLNKSINSVISQTYNNWELIVIDDGSTDNTKEVVSAIIGQDKRVKYYFQNNAERSAARNNGISKATGQFVCFLDSDDRFSPNHLEGLYDAIKRNNSQKNIYVVKSRILDTAGKEKVLTKIISGNNDFETVVSNSITPGQFCIPKEYLILERFDETIRISEDTEILFRLVRLAKLKVVNQYTLEYMQHEDNSVNPLRYNAYAERYKTLQKIFSYPDAAKISKQLKRKMLSDCFFGINRFYCSQKKWFKARLTMLEALIKYPEIRWKEKVYLLINPYNAAF